MSAIKNWWKENFSGKLPDTGLGPLHRNNFYNSTPISGWIFVYRSKTRKELAFWYAVCITFLGIAIYNVQHLCVNYYSKPTRSRVLFRTSTRDIKMPNMTLVLKLPLLEFAQQVPVPFKYKKAAHTMKTDWSPYLSANKHLQPLYSYVCSSAFDSDYQIKMTQETIENYQKQLLSNSLPELLNDHDEAKSNMNELFSAHTVDTWLKMMGDAESEITLYWEHLLSQTVDQQANMNIEGNTTRLTNDLIKNKPNNIIFKLIALESIMNGLDAHAILKTGTKHSGKSVKLALNALNKDVAQLLKSVQADLGSFLNIQITGGTPFFSGFDLDGWEMENLDDIKVDRVYLQNPYQTLTFSLIPDPDTRLIEIVVYSFMDIWHKHIVLALNDLVQKYGITEEICKEQLMFKYFSFLELDMMVLYMNMFPQLQMADQSVFVTPKRSSNVTLMPRMQLSSNTDRFNIGYRCNTRHCYCSCFHPKNVACHEDCIVEKYLEKCLCVPWTLALYAQSGTTLCVELCSFQSEIEQECSAFCDLLLKHPCNFVISRMTAIDLELESYGIRDTKVHNIRIYMPEISHFAHTIEEYELSTSAILSQIGGALEFWSGFNILCAFHILFFILFHPHTVSVLEKIVQKQATGPKTESIVKKVKGDPLSLTELKEEIDQLKNRIHKKLPAASEGRMANSRFAWLKENRWFKQTPMAGYNYIVAASTATETVFWYLLIFVLAVITGFNLHSTFEHYFSHPTAITIFPTFSRESLNVPNITLELHLPLMELSRFNISTDYNIETEHSFDELFQLYLTTGTTAFDLEAELFSEWIDAMEFWPEVKVTHSGVSVLSDPAIFMKWQQLLVESKEILSDMANKQFHLSWQEMQQQIVPQLLWRPLVDRSGLLFLKSILMNSLSKSNIQLHLLPDEEKYMYDLNMTSSSILSSQGITSKELMIDTFDLLSRLIYIEMEPKPLVAVPSGLGASSLNKYILQVSIPITGNVTQFRIHVYSFVYMWLNALQQWFDELQSRDYSPTFWLLAQINSIDLIDSALLEYDHMYGRIFVDGIEHSSQFLSFETLGIELRPIWQMSSYTDNCHTEPYESCEKKCQIDEFIENCACIPWEYFYVDRFTEADICNRPCVVINSEALTNCLHSCSFQCRRNLFEKFNSGVFSVISSDSALFEIHGEIKQSLHPVFLEQYQLSIGELLSNIGGLLDFWLGANLLAVVHLVVYFIKRIGTRNNHENQNKQLVNARKLLNQVNDLKDMINKSMNEDESIEINEENSGKPWFGWVWGNRFFDETSLTGFEFIASAKYRVEAVFWWLLITVFCVLTVFNIHNAVMHYYSRPTRINVQVESEGDHIQIGNLTLEFELLLADFSIHNPTSLRYAFDDVAVDGETTIAEHLACVINAAPGYMIGQHMAETLFVNWLTTLDQNWVSPNHHVTHPDSFYSQETLDQWQLKMNDARSELVQFLKDKGKDTMPKEHKAKDTLKQSLLELFDGPMKRWSTNLGLHLMALESLKTGKEPKRKLHQMLTDEETNAFLYRLFIPHVPDYEGFNSSTVSPLMLYNLVLEELSSLLNIEILGAPEARVYLHDWSYKTSEQIEGISMVKDHSFSFVLAVPHNTMKLDVVIHSFMHLWLYKLMDALYVYFDDIGMAFKPVCGHNAIGDIVLAQREVMQDWIWADSQNVRLRVVGQGGWDVVIAPFMFHEYIELIPTMSFISKTIDCFDGSRERCIDHCVLLEYQNFCGCVPWTLLYMEGNQGFPVCTEPCLKAIEQTEHCSSSCEQKLLHPCSIGLYNPVQRSFRNYSLGEYAPIYSFSIEVWPTDHIVYGESYSMTLSDLIGQLGGLFDLWMGINLLSIIHVAVFAFKYCIKSKTTARKVQDGGGDGKVRKQLMKQSLLVEVEQINKFLLRKIVELSSKQKF